MRPTTFSADVTTTLKRLVYAHTSFFSMLIITMEMGVILSSSLPLFSCF
jgi:hypothetical protein